MCFSICLAHALAPGCTDSEARLRGERLQSSAGLTVNTPMTFTDLYKFEEIVSRKIVVFHRTGPNRVLQKCETGFSDRNNPVFLFLHHNHYYETTILKAFLGSEYTCQYCFLPSNKTEQHFCDGYCPVCRSTSRKRLEKRFMRCADCDLICYNTTCYEKHKIPGEGGSFCQVNNKMLRLWKQIQGF